MYVSPYISQLYSLSENIDTRSKGYYDLNNLNELNSNMHNIYMNNSIQWALEYSSITNSKMTIVLLSILMIGKTCRLRLKRRKRLFFFLKRLLRNRKLLHHKRYSRNILEDANGNKNLLRFMFDSFKNQNYGTRQKSFSQ